MPKRSCPDDNVVQPIKKQHNNHFKSRKIRSLSSERSLQLLYEGAAKIEHTDKKERVKETCSTCSKLVLSTVKCEFCERDLCEDCKNLCYKCKNDYCNNCTLQTYDQNNSVCLSCCSY